MSSNTKLNCVKKQSTNLLDEHKLVLTLCAFVDLILIPEDR